MDRKRKKKLENARVIMTNIFMGISVIGIVFVLMLIAMGYNFNEKGGIEQSGLIQISSNQKAPLSKLMAKLSLVAPTSTRCSVLATIASKSANPAMILGKKPSMSTPAYLRA